MHAFTHNNLVDAQIRQILEWSGEPGRALGDFEQFLAQYREKTGHEFDLEPVNAKRLLTLFGNSHFLTQFLIHHPKEADHVVASPCIETDKKPSDFQEELAEFVGNPKKISPTDFDRQLRLYKYREFLRLTVKDFSQAAGLESVMHELSDLAAAIIQTNLDFLMIQMAQDWGRPFVFGEKIQKKSCGFSVIAMGKLGGRELNYSSDVDLQFIYESDEGGAEHPKGNHGREGVSNHEFFVKLSERITRSLSQNTGDGFLYRVDLNLRPEGKSGTLSNSLAAIEHYYEIFGQEWERQALIKAVPVAGDEKLGKSFRELISPFVWRKSLDTQTVEKMKEMKRKVHDSVKAGSSKGFNVKLDEGGIREIEFFAQTLQLLYGGTHPELRSPETLSTLDTLAKLDLIKIQEAKALKEAYLFLRRVEHRLQVVHEAQTHLVLHSAKEQMALARRMGYFEDDPEAARERFLDDLTRYTTMVKNTFRNLFE